MTLARDPQPQLGAPARAPDAEHGGVRGGPEQRFVDDGPIRWHVSTMGQGPVALLLHGTGASCHSFDGLMPRLAERFTVVAPDLPGHARTRVSSAYEPSLPHVARALGGLMTVLELRPQLIVGHSAGAAIAARMALDGLAEPALLVGLAAALVPFRGLARAVLHPAAALLSRSVVPALIAAGFARTPQVDRIVRSTGSVLDRRGLESYRSLIERPEHVAGVLSMMASWDLDPLYDALPGLETPFLLLTGDNDRAAPVAQIRAASARLPHSTVVVVERTGHLLHEEQPMEVARLILEHLDRPQQQHENS